MNDKFFKLIILNLAGLLVLVSAGCSEIKVDSFQKWCELISGEGPWTHFNGQPELRVKL